jgi:OmpA-OmpF porin, OOP family
MRRPVSAILALTLGVAFAGVALAQEPAWYVGGAIGQSKDQDYCDGAAAFGVSCDDSDGAFKLFGGYRMNRNFAIEGGFAFLGTVTASVPGLVEEFETTAFDVTAMGILPIGAQFSVHGKIGLYMASTEGKATGFASETERNGGLTFGAGAGLDFSRNFGVRVEWQRYQDVGGDFGESDIDLTSIGVLWRF